MKKISILSKLILIFTISIGFSFGLFAMPKAYASETAPVIITQPQTVTTTSNKSVTFTVEAEGTNLQYIWQIKKTLDGYTWTNMTDVDGFNYTTNTVTTIPIDYDMSGYLYRCIVTNGDTGESVLSDTAIVQILEEGKVQEVVYCHTKIISQPLSLKCQSGDIANFSIDTEGTNLEYRWQYKTTVPGDSWRDVTDEQGNGYTSKEFTTKKIKNEMNGYMYRCIVKNNISKNLFYSDVAILIVSPNTIQDVVLIYMGDIIKQPLDQRIEAGKSGEFSIVLDASVRDVVYRWQYKTPANGDSWKDATASQGSGYNTATFITVPTTVEMSGYRFRCIATSESFGRTVYSDAAAMIVEEPYIQEIEYAYMDITKQPLDKKINLGDSAEFSVEMEASNLEYIEYKWQYKTPANGDSWKDATASQGSGYDTDTFTTVATTMDMSGYKYRCVITNKNSQYTIYSDAAALMVEKPYINEITYVGVKITEQPTTQNVMIGKKGVFTVGVEISGMEPRYRWQYRINQIDSWHDVTEGTGYTTNTYTTGETTTHMNGYQYRCLITNTISSNVFYSDAATLLVMNKLDETIYYEHAKILEHPETVVAENGDNVEFKIVTSGDNLEYRWQYKTAANGDSWYDITDEHGIEGYSTTKITINAVTDSLSGYQYRCLVTNTISQNTLYSDAATLIIDKSYVEDIVQKGIKIVDEPLTKSVNIGDFVEFSVGAIVSKVEADYKWQYKSDIKDGIWQDVTELQGVEYNTDTFTIGEATIDMNGYQFRCVITNKESLEMLYSDSATLIVEPYKPIINYEYEEFFITKQPITHSVLLKNKAVFSIDTVGENQVFKWQVKKPITGHAWTDCTEDDGTNYDTKTFTTIETTKDMSGYMYRCVVINTLTGNTIISDVATLIVQENLTDGDAEIAYSSDAVLMERENIGYMIGAYRDNPNTTFTADLVGKVIFSKEIPEGTIEASWDASLVQNDNPVMSYLVKGDIKNGVQLYNQYFVNTSTIVAPPNSISLFEGYSNMSAMENMIHFDGGRVITTEKMYYGCKSLESLDMKYFTTNNVTSMKQMFENCTLISELDLRGFNTLQVTSMDGMFKNSSNLKTIILGENFDKLGTLGNEFEGCIDLEKIISFRKATNEVMSIPNTSNALTSITNVKIYVVSDAEEKYEDNTNYKAVFSNVKDRIEPILKLLGNKKDAVLLDNEYKDDGVLVIGLDQSLASTYNSYGLKLGIASNVNTEVVGTYEVIYTLTDLNRNVVDEVIRTVNVVNFIKEWDISKVENAGNAFAKLEFLDGDGSLERSNFRLVIYGTGETADYIITEDGTSTAPYILEGYKDRILEIELVDGITRYGNSLLRGLSNATTITKIPASVTSIGDYALSNLAGIENFEVAKESTAYETIDGIVYTKVTEGSGGKTLVAYPIGRGPEDLVIDAATTVIKTSAFEGADISTITFSSVITTIENRAFYGTDMPNMTIPATITSIGVSAFENTLAREFYIKSESIVVAENAFANMLEGSIIYTESKAIAITAFTADVTHTDANTKIYYPYEFTADMENQELARGVTFSITPSIQVGYIDDAVFEWYLNGEAILGANEMIYTKANFTDSDEGTYKLVIRSANKGEDDYYYEVISNEVEVTLGDFEVPYSLNTVVSYNEDGTATVTITASDAETGIDTIVVSGENVEITKTVPEDGTPGGSATGSFTVSEKGVYEIVASDYKQNKITEKFNAYKIIYEPNGATGETLSQIKINGVGIKLRKNGFKQVGYVFKEWNTLPVISEENIGVGYAPGATYSEDADLTLYAIWEIQKYTVKFYNDNGIDGVKLVSEATYSYGETIRVPEAQYKYSTEIVDGMYRIYKHDNNWIGKKVDANGNEIGSENYDGSESIDSVVNINSTNMNDITMIDSDVNYYASYTYKDFDENHASIKIDGSSTIKGEQAGIENYEGLVIIGKSSTEENKPVIEGNVFLIYNQNGVVLWYKAGFKGPTFGPTISLSTE